jgi:hypothetical protein
MRQAGICIAGVHRELTHLPRTGSSAAGTAGSRPCHATSRQPRTVADGRPITESNFSLCAAAQRAAVGYLESKSGCPRCSRRGCFVGICCLVDALPGQCLRRKPRAYPLVAAVFRTNGYCVSAVRLHVNAADLLVRRGMDSDGSRYPVCALVPVSRLAVRAAPEHSLCGGAEWLGAGPPPVLRVPGRSGHGSPAGIGDS